MDLRFRNKHDFLEEKQKTENGDANRETESLKQHYFHDSFVGTMLPTDVNSLETNLIDKLVKPVNKLSVRRFFQRDLRGLFGATQEPNTV